jgi:hypothetical protein
MGNQTGEADNGAAVLYESQKIVVQVNTDTQKGRISVIVSTEFDDVTAESDQDYTPRAVEPEKDEPVVDSIRPRRLKPGGQGSLSGKNLKEVRTVGLLANGLYKQCRVTSTSRTGVWVNFTVPTDTTPSENQQPYPVFTNTAKYGWKRCTGVTLLVLKE